MDLKATRQAAESIWKAGVAAVDPRRLVAEHARQTLGPQLAQAGIREILVVGAGKAGQAMTLGLREGLPPEVALEGLVLVPEGGQDRIDGVEVRAVRPAGINLPTPRAMEGTLSILERARRAQVQQRVVALVSGGGSALTPAPVEGVSLEEKLTATRTLAAAGADIHQLNTVRKHLSRFKGGGLARAVAQSPLGTTSIASPRLYSLIISDVVGDPLEVIGSGPTVADPSTFGDCLAICHDLGVWENLPPGVRAYLEKGAKDPRLETLKTVPDWVVNTLLGSNRRALQAAAGHAREGGWPVLDLGSHFEGDTRALAAFHLALLRGIRDGHPQRPPLCLLSGGETTVKLGPEPGPGGRNQEFALSFLRGLKAAETERFCLLAGGTDGEDGPTTAAGGFADAQAWQRLAQWRQTAPTDWERLVSHDENHAILQKIGALFHTGPTGTNVMDLRVLLVDG